MRTKRTPPFEGHGVRIALVRETPARLLPATYIRGPDDIARLARELTDTDREHFAVILLNTKNRVLGVNIVSIGTLDAALVSPRELFKPVLLASASKVICCHNHPSDDPAPSDEDIQVTQRLKQAGEILGIPVLDHVILGSDSHFSMLEHGLL